MQPALPTPHPALVGVSLFLLVWILLSQIRLLIQGLRRRPFWPDPLPRPVCWNERAVLAVLVFWIGLQLSVSSVAGRERLKTLSARELMTITGVVNVVLLVVGPLLVASMTKVRVRDLDLIGPDPGRNFLRGARTWPMLACWIYAIFFLALRFWKATKHPVEEMIRADRSVLTMSLAFVTAVILAPLAEEFLFRGLLLGWLTKYVLPRPPAAEGVSEARDEADFVDQAVLELSESEPGPEKNHERKPWLGLWAANIVTSVVFATLHGSAWPSPIPIFLLSLGLGVLYQKTGGIAAPLGLHLTFNLISTVVLNLSLLTQPHEEGQEKEAVPKVLAPDMSTVVWPIRVNLEKNQ
jgi:membrane protease YdiL (CAAX protease family)